MSEAADRGGTAIGHEVHEVQRPGNHPAHYEAPTSLDDALALLDHFGRRARPVAGGTDLLVELDRGGHRGVDVLVDLSRIPGLGRIRSTDRMVRLGATTTHNQVVAHSDCPTAVTPLAQACREVGSPQLRNRATVAGNLATASPANDTISALLALGASVELTSLDESRTLPVADLITGFRATAIAAGELITAIEVPRLGPDQRGVFVKAGLRRAQAISVVHLAVVVTLDDGVVTDATLALGSVAPVVITVPAVVDALRGRPLTGTGSGEAIATAARAAAAAAAPIDDLRAPADYRRDLVATMTSRALAALGAGTQLDTWPPGGPPLLRRRGAAAGRTTGRPTSIDPDDPITVTVNGDTVTAPGAAGEVLLDWLRSAAGTTGVKEGCAEGECGACTVELDGAAVLACLIPAGRADGATITTVEGLADGSALHVVQDAFVATGAVQCGFCTPGLISATAVLLDECPTPTRDQTSDGLAGNLCRCTGYGAIHEAVALAAAAGTGEGDRSATAVTVGAGEVQR